ncbi:Vacuolar segregation protein (Pep7), putative [Penicillium digitatum PHI26]|uniref:Vacuolar segregation protein (Pep7), putative n=2 Tax=Penicillium digitatum TaxID=36651 RepID=K9GSX0_PEND2|nr:Vacuolar segregation protein (Pep7), putative [Penicillium digitatum Pd1]EKV16191.1 Vacuolar segregation protein (Pep7), putative [Penicillium digitatum PHI26]EKV19388.1 Vacuolar segregation protein (Pep7), putative [Penicillium digitatum Pd1]
MSRRTLGGGRVLGNPRALASAPSPQPKPRVLSPTTSSVSLNSQAASQLSVETQDLTSRISIENGDTSISAAPAAPGAQLSCPICSEQMMTLLQLNRHLDDIHQNLEDSHQDEVKDWFKVQMEKARKFQPLAVLNQKLKGLDVFESNENQGAPLPGRPLAPHAGISEPPKFLDPEDLITKDHWQRSSMYDECLEPSCGKRLNATNGCVNCRSCGNLFCEEHTMYQMKLSRAAHHEPVRGIWARVTGTVRNRMDAFKSIRKQTVDKEFLEISRLEKRLTRLTQLLASLPPDQIHPSTTKLWSLAWQNDQRKEIEQTIVSWQDDSSVSRCPFCQQDFSGYTFRRHHCRTCGRVVCGDPSTECSSEVGLSFSPDSTATSEKPNGDNLVNIDVRLCKECKTTLFDRRDFKADTTRKSPEMRAYENLAQFERGIRLHLPRFQKLLTALQDPMRPPSSAQIADASKVRKRLIDSFAQYDFAARRIRDMPTQSPTQQKLQKAIYQQASNFLHLHMLPLKSLPKTLKHATPASERIPSRTSSPRTSSPSIPVDTSTTGLRPPESALSSINYNSVAASGSNSSLASDTSSAISALEAEEKTLRDRLIVLEEQKFFVSEMIADANRRRKFDEVSSLAINVEDLSREIDRVNGMLANLDFEGLYTGNSQPSS